MMRMRVVVARVRRLRRSWLVIAIAVVGVSLLGIGARLVRSSVVIVGPHTVGRIRGAARPTTSDGPDASSIAAMRSYIRSWLLALDEDPASKHEPSLARRFAETFPSWAARRGIAVRTCLVRSAGLRVFGIEIEQAHEWVLVLSKGSSLGWCVDPYLASLGIGWDIGENILRPFTPDVSDLISGCSRARSG